MKVKTDAVKTTPNKSETLRTSINHNKSDMSDQETKISVVTNEPFLNVSERTESEKQ